MSHSKLHLGFGCILAMHLVTKKVVARIAGEWHMVKQYTEHSGSQGYF